MSLEAAIDTSHQPPTAKEKLFQLFARIGSNEFQLYLQHHVPAASDFHLHITKQAPPAQQISEVSNLLESRKLLHEDFFQQLCQHFPQHIELIRDAQQACSEKATQTPPTNTMQDTPAISLELEVAQAKLEALHSQEEEQLLNEDDTTAVRVAIKNQEERILQLRRLSAISTLRPAPIVYQPFSPDCVLAGRYRLKESIGKGGFARVWKAFDFEDRRVVAVKVLREDLKDERSKVERFLRGAREMAKLEHPSIVKVVGEPGQLDGRPYFVMEYLKGGDFAQAFAEQRLTWEAALPYLLDVASALSHAHSQGLIHRDVKPQNILLDSIGNAKITDFDLVRVEETDARSLTNVTGTFLYAAPEMLNEHTSTGIQIDVYGLGMTVLFSFCEGDLPAQEIIYDRSDFFNHLDCTPELKEVFEKSIAYKLEERFENIDAFILALKAALHHQTQEAPNEHLPPQTSTQTRTQSIEISGKTEAPTPFPKTPVKNRFWGERIQLILVLLTLMFSIILLNDQVETMNDELLSNRQELMSNHHTTTQLHQELYELRTATATSKISREIEALNLHLNDDDVIVRENTKVRISQLFAQILQLHQDERLLVQSAHLSVSITLVPKTLEEAYLLNTQTKHTLEVADYTSPPDMIITLSPPSLNSTDSGTLRDEVTFRSIDNAQNPSIQYGPTYTRLQNQTTKGMTLLDDVRYIDPVVRILGVPIPKILLNDRHFLITSSQTVKQRDCPSHIVNLSTLINSPPNAPQTVSFFFDQELFDGDSQPSVKALSWDGEDFWSPTRGFPAKTPIPCQKDTADHWTCDGNFNNAPQAYVFHIPREGCLPLDIAVGSVVDVSSD